MPNHKTADHRRVSGAGIQNGKQPTIKHHRDAVTYREKVVELFAGKQDRAALVTFVEQLREDELADSYVQATSWLVAEKKPRLWQIRAPGLLFGRCRRKGGGWVLLAMALRFHKC